MKLPFLSSLNHIINKMTNLIGVEIHLKFIQLNNETRRREKNNAKRQNAKQNKMRKIFQQRGGKKNIVQPQVICHGTQNYLQAYILWFSFNFPYIYIFF